MDATQNVACCVSCAGGAEQEGAAVRGVVGVSCGERQCAKVLWSTGRFVTNSSCLSHSHRQYPYLASIALFSC